MSEFSLHRQLRDDCHLIGDLELSRVLLLNDCRYPWVVLVPRRAAITEIYQLSRADRELLLDESCRVGELLMRDNRERRENTSPAFQVRIGKVSIYPPHAGLSKGRYLLEDGLGVLGGHIIRINKNGQ